MTRVLTFISVLFFCLPAFALTIESPLPDAAQEARARALFYEVRCVVCQGESVADSPADIATDMRRLIRQRVAAGESDQSIRDYLVGQYGDFILMKPPLKRTTYLLWFGPFLVLALAAFAAWRFFRRARL